MKIENELKLDFKDVLLRPKRSTLASRNDVELSREYNFKWSKHNWKGIPIMASNMDGVGTFDMATALSKFLMFTCAVKSFNVHEWLTRSPTISSNSIAVSTGTSDSDFKKLKEIISLVNLEFICIDVANGYSEHFGDFVSKIRDTFPTKTIIAGNVVTSEMTQELILRGADIIKIGIGPGSVCTTRIQTGVGYPQLSAIIECADAAHGLGGHIIADGGCTCPGDIAKAFGAGADFVMLGGMLAGHDEGGGQVITERTDTGKSELDVTGNTWVPIFEYKHYVEFYGMSSTTAMIKTRGEVAEYRSSEGRVVRVPARGPVISTVRDMLGGLRSACTYVGAANLKQLSKCITFVRTNSQYNLVFTKE